MPVKASRPASGTGTRPILSAANLSRPEERKNWAKPPRRSLTGLRFGEPPPGWQTGPAPWLATVPVRCAAMQTRRPTPARRTVAFGIDIGSLSRHQLFLGDDASLGNSLPCSRIAPLSKLDSAVTGTAELTTWEAEGGNARDVFWVRTVRVTNAIPITHYFPDLALTKPTLIRGGTHDIIRAGEVSSCVVWATTGVGCLHRPRRERQCQDRSARNPKDKPQQYLCHRTSFAAPSAIGFGQARSAQYDDPLCAHFRLHVNSSIRLFWVSHSRTIAEEGVEMFTLPRRRRSGDP